MRNLCVRPYIKFLQNLHGHDVDVCITYMDMMLMFAELPESQIALSLLHVTGEIFRCLGVAIKPIDDGFSGFLKQVASQTELEHFKVPECFH